MSVKYALDLFIDGNLVTTSYYDTKGEAIVASMESAPVYSPRIVREVDVSEKEVAALGKLEKELSDKIYSIEKSMEESLRKLTEAKMALGNLKAKGVMAKAGISVDGFAYIASNNEQLN